MIGCHNRYDPLAILAHVAACGTDIMASVTGHDDGADTATLPEQERYTSPRPHRLHPSSHSVCVNTSGR
jgi:hypothetical protein